MLNYNVTEKDKALLLLNNIVKDPSNTKSFVTNYPHYLASGNVDLTYTLLMSAFHVNGAPNRKTISGYVPNTKILGELF